MSSDDLIRMSATQAVARLRRGEISPLDLVEAAARRIEAVNPAVNALPTLCLDRAREHAAAIGARPGDVDARRWLAGLPIAVKDYNDVGGVRTTHGSPIHAQDVATRSDATVRRLERHGAVPLGKSNVPEFAGANTFNPVFGATRNPWDTRMSVAGSSGGSAAALATGMAWLATGNDLGGSLRTPASFCSVVGLRPGPGRVPRGAGLPAFDTLWVEGPMGRTVADVALMLDAQAGRDADDPLSFESVAGEFVAALEGTDLPRRVAFSPDLGVVAVEPEVAESCARAARGFASLGAEVVDASPDFAGAIEAFQTLRGVLFGAKMGPALAVDRERIAPHIVWNIEKGLATPADALLEAHRVRHALYHRVVAFFERHDLLLCPAASVPPFPVEQQWVESIAGEPTHTYIDWIAITFAITMTSCPALSLPCGFTAAGLPVGVQIVAPPRGEAALLRAAHRLEEALGIAPRLPIDPRATATPAA